MPKVTGRANNLDFLQSLCTIRYQSHCYIGKKMGCERRWILYSRDVAFMTASHFFLLKHEESQYWDAETSSFLKGVGEFYVQQVLLMFYCHAIIVHI